MKKAYILIIVPVITILTLIFSAADNEQKAIGIISYFEGELQHKYGDTADKIKKGSFIYQNSEIILNSGKSAKIELLTLSGIYQISKFPAKDFKSFKIIDKESQDIFKDAIAGSFITRSSSNIIQWDMNIGTVIDEDIKNKSLKLILSPTESSFEKKSYMPLIFKIDKSLKYKKAEYSITDQSKNIIHEGLFTKDSDKFIFDFSSFNYNLNVNYLIKIYPVLENDQYEEYTYSFKIISKADFDLIQKEADNAGASISSEILRNLNTAKIYQKYKLNIIKNNYLIKLGISL